MASLLTSVPQKNAERALKEAVGVAWGHRFGTVSVSHEKVTLSSLFSVIDTVAHDNFRSAQNLLDRYEASGIEPYFPTYLEADPTEGVLFAPIIERHPLGLIILDGVHRSLAAYHKGLESIYATILSSGRSPDPPRSPLPLDTVSVAASTVVLTPLFQNKNNKNFRPSAKFVALARKTLIESASEKDPR